MIQGAGIVSVLLFRALYRVLRGSLAGERKLVLGPVTPDPEMTASGTMRLSVDGGVESWLDLTTGAIETREAAPAPPPEPSPVFAPNEPPSAMMRIVRAALDERRLRYLAFNGSSIAMPWSGERSRWIVIVNVSDATREFYSWTALGPLVPTATRPAVKELIEHINERFEASRLDLDDEDGAVSIRIWLAPTVEELTPEMVRDAVFRLIEDAEICHDAIMRVAYGGKSVGEAIAEQELW